MCHKNRGTDPVETELCPLAGYELGPNLRNGTKNNLGGMRLSPYGVGMCHKNRGTAPNETTLLSPDGV